MNDHPNSTDATNVPDSGDSGDSSRRTSRDRGAGHDAPPGDVPNEATAEREFPHTDAESLRDAIDLTDEEGDDVRRYSGEPVPTEHGEVIPQQMAVGRETTVGGGEWPDAPPRGEEGDGGQSDDDDSGPGG